MSTRFVSAGGHRLEVETIDLGAGRRPTIVMLHEGLGSVAMWRDFPGRVAHATQCRVIVYSRYSYGNSEPLTGPHTVDYMHREALVVLPELLDALGVARPILLGHSDGGSIALIHAGGSGRAVAGLALMAPHVFAEDVTVRSIAAAKVAWERTDLRTDPRTDLRARLGRYHADVDGAFRGWNDIWLNPDFRAWNIENYLAAIACPILAIQGNDDEYGTMAQIEAIAAQAPDVDLFRLEDCRHSPHKDQPEAVLAALTRFVDRLS